MDAYDRLPAMSTPAPHAAAGFWHRRVVAPIVAQLTQGVTPDRLALTLGLGLACGVFPFLGFTTVLCALVAAALRLNQPVIHLVNQLLWPVQLAGIPLYVAFGQRLFGAAPVPVDPQEIARVFAESPAEFWTRFGLMGLHALTAWLVTVPILVGAAYSAARPILRLAASKTPRRP